MAFQDYYPSQTEPDISGDSQPWNPGQYDAPPPTPMPQELSSAMIPPAPTAPAKPQAFIDPNGRLVDPTINGGQIIPNNSTWDPSGYDPSNPSGQAGTNAIWESQSDRGAGGPKTVTQRVLAAKPEGYEDGPKYMAQAYKSTYEMAKELGLSPGDPRFNQFVDKTITQMRGKAADFIHAPISWKLGEDGAGNPTVFNPATGELKPTPNPNSIKTGATPRERLDANKGNAKYLSSKQGKQDQLIVNHEDSLANQQASGIEKAKAADEKQWMHVVEKAVPSQATRGPLGRLYDVDGKSQRALTLLANPVVTGQMLAGAAADLSSVLQGGAATQYGMKEQDFSTLKSKAASLLQWVTGHPTDALPEELKKSLVNTLTEVHGQNVAQFNQNLDTIEHAYPELIKKYSDEWKNIRSDVGGGVRSGRDVANLQLTGKIPAGKIIVIAPDGKTPGYFPKGQPLPPGYTLPK